MSSPETATMDESLEQMQARHRKEQRDLQGRITSKKKNATKKTRKFVNDECADLERQLKERQEEELRKLTGEADEQGLTDGDDTPQDQQPDQSQQQPQSPPVINDLATKLQTTTLSPDSQQPPSASAPTKQKRNRQKERLARRAAEQEAAAVAAEHEASSMTDHRGAERESMQAAFAARSLREHEIAPDGHCLFSAVADQLTINDIPLIAAAAGSGTEPKVAPYRVVRRAAADWIENHRAQYEGFLEEGVEAYVGKIRDTAEWGGELELSALANAYGVEIRVLQGGSRVEVVKPGEGKEERARRFGWRI
ncbi:hypothetical protein NEMBOFW57_004933 [Staphylotrichum longicolle]|uniref:OTU domain-containing protein n=1 Tax=Staphylotrichum longicolle TaxID=669026 RepID=A0AAD4EWD4_9PEZI|nr:hypothetical protein NEMBOFW57_004933 [Staphylotrichum longicolle]